MKSPTLVCPNPDCRNHLDPQRGFYVRNGIRRKRDGQRVRRYRCRACGKYFCATQTKPTKRQHRPDLNAKVLGRAARGVSLRTMEARLGCSKTTLRRKITYLAGEAQRAHARFLAKTRTGFVTLDEFETFIHSKRRKVSVPVVVNVKTGDILAFDVCCIPSAALDAGAGVSPPGIRQRAWTPDDRPRVSAVLAAVKPALRRSAVIATDGDDAYPDWIARALPGVKHLILRSALRTPRNTLARMALRTWTTSKTVGGLRNHLWLYVAWNNGYRLR